MELYKSQRGGDTCLYKSFEYTVKLKNDALDEAPKMTNCTEGWHNALKALFLSAHPSMWTMFRGLRKDIAIQKLVIIQANAAHADSPKPKYKKLAERLRRKVEKYPDELDKLKCLRAISHIQ